MLSMSRSLFGTLLLLLRLLIYNAIDLIVCQEQVQYINPDLAVLMDFKQVLVKDPALCERQKMDCMLFALCLLWTFVKSIDEPDLMMF